MWCLVAAVSHVLLNIRDSCDDNLLLLLWGRLLLADCVNDLNILLNSLLNWRLYNLWLGRHHRCGNGIRGVLRTATWGASSVMGLRASYRILQSHLALLFGREAALVTRACCIGAVLFMAAQSDFHAVVSAANAVRLLPARRISILIGHRSLQSS